MNRICAFVPWCSQSSFLPRAMGNRFSSRPCYLFDFCGGRGGRQGFLGSQQRGRAQVCLFLLRPAKGPLASQPRFVNPICKSLVKGSPPLPAAPRPPTWWPKMHLDREEKFRLAMASGGTLAFLLSGHGPSCAMIGVDRAPDMKAYYCFESPSAQPPALAQGPHQPDKGGRLAPLLCFCQPGSPRHVGCTVSPC